MVAKSSPSTRSAASLEADMADIISLSRVRKARTRARKQTLATENRVNSGMSRRQKDELAAIKARTASLLEGHRLEAGKPASLEPDDR